jgi:hypothetical protein
VCLSLGTSLIGNLRCVSLSRNIFDRAIHGVYVCVSLSQVTSLLGHHVVCVSSSRNIYYRSHVFCLCISKNIIDRGKTWSMYIWEHRYQGNKWGVCISQGTSLILEHVVCVCISRSVVDRATSGTVYISRNAVAMIHLL